MRCACACAHAGGAVEDGGGGSHRHEDFEEASRAEACARAAWSGGLCGGNHGTQRASTQRGRSKRHRTDSSRARWARAVGSRGSPGIGSVPLRRPSSAAVASSSAWFSFGLYGPCWSASPVVVFGFVVVGFGLPGVLSKRSRVPASGNSRGWYLGCRVAYWPLDSSTPSFVGPCGFSFSACLFAALLGPSSPFFPLFGCSLPEGMSSNTSVQPSCDGARARERPPGRQRRWARVRGGGFASESRSNLFPPLL